MYVWPVDYFSLISLMNLLKLFIPRLFVGPSEHQYPINEPNTVSNQGTGRAPSNTPRIWTSEPELWD